MATNDATCVTKVSSTTADAQSKAKVIAYREVGHSIASQFPTIDFNPLPSLTNRHVQTISGVYLRTVDSYKYVTVSSAVELAQVSATSLVSAFWTKDTDNSAASAASARLSLNPDREGFYDERQRFETPDGDFFDVDFKYCDELSWEIPSKGTVVVLHGLQSNSQSSLSVDMATAYINQGFDVAFMNFRGCSGEMNRKMAGYHLGFTDDLKQFLEHLKIEREKEPNNSNSIHASRPVFLSGFSLGSNVVLKCLGELGETAHTEYGIYGAAVCGVPFDQERNINFVQAPGFNRMVYMNFLLRSLKERSLEQMQLFEGSEEWEKIDYEKVVNAESISDIENAVLAPVYGFQDNIDYYRQNRCLEFLDSVAVPTLIINAADDPFFDPDSDVFPWHKSSDFNETSPIRMKRTAHGGHLGFMFHQTASPSANESLVDFASKERASWMPAELSRFLDFVDKNKEKLDKVSLGVLEDSR